MKKIILTGYMGSGKSIIGQILAEKLEIPHFDLDDLIQNECKLSIPEIFKSKGELFFRKKEHLILLKKCEEKASFVLSLGGGTPCYYNNHEVFMLQDILSIYLKASVATLVERLEQNIQSRPLLANFDPEDKTEFVAKHLFERSYFYNQAEKKITVDCKSIDEIVLEITEILS